MADSIGGSVTDVAKVDDAAREPDLRPIRLLAVSVVGTDEKELTTDDPK
ncbi:MAG: hypothetical protein AAAC47_15780 [Pararhizobium sp.]